MTQDNQANKYHIRETVKFANGVTITFTMKCHVARMGDTIYLSSCAYFAPVDVAKVSRLASAVEVILTDGRDVGIDFANPSNAWYMFADMMNALGIPDREDAGIWEAHFDTAKEDENTDT
jgi:hypothetical protein